MISRKTLRFFYIIGILLLQHTFSYSADYYAVTVNPTYEGGSYSLFGYLIKVIFYLALLSAGLYYILKNVVPRLKTVPRQGGQIEVIDFRALTPNASCQLVKVGSRYFLLGVTNAQVTLIQEMDIKEIGTHSYSESAVEATTPAIQNFSQLGQSFQEILKKIIKK